MINGIKVDDKEFVFESVMERHIQQFIDTLRKNNLSIRKFFNNMAVPAFEKVDASCVKVYRDMDRETIRVCTDIIVDYKTDYPDTMIFFVSNKEIIGGVYRGTLLCMYNDRGRYYDIQSSKLHECFKNAQARMSSHSKSWMKYISTVADEAWVVDLDGCETYTLRKERAAQKAGMIMMNDESFKKIAESNRERYLSLAQEIRAKKGTAGKYILKKANEEIDRGMAIISKFQKSIQQYVDTDVKSARNLYTVVGDMNREIRRVLDFVDVMVGHQFYGSETKKDGNISSSTFYTDKHDEDIKSLEGAIERLKNKNDVAESLMNGFE